MNRGWWRHGVLAALAVVLGCGESVEETVEEIDSEEILEAEETLPGGDAVRGAELYATYCSLCHGEEGEGYKADQANALSHPEFLATATDEFLRHALVRGRPGTTMSAWHVDAGGPLEDNDITDLVALMRSWQTAPSLDVHGYVPEGVASRAEDLYEIRCASCHGEQGQNGFYMSISNPEFLATASDGYLHHALVVGRQEAGMPAFGNVLTPQQIDDLVVLIRSWQVDPEAPPTVLPETKEGELILNPNGGEPAFELDAEGRVSVKQVEAAYDEGAKMVLLDARLPSEYLHGHISGAVSIPFYSVGQYVEWFDPDVWVIAYCACPHAESGVAADALRDAGLTKVTVIDEGYDAWVEDGYPITEGPTP